MKKITQGMLVFFVIISTLAACAAAESTPVLPQVIKGSVTINGAPAAVDTSIFAVMNGAVAGSTFVTIPGNYTFIVEGTLADNGKDVAIYVNNIITDKSTTWGSGKVDTINLAVQQAQSTTTTARATTTTIRESSSGSSSSGSSGSRHSTATTSAQPTTTTEKQGSSEVITPPEAGSQDSQSQKTSPTLKISPPTTTNSPPILLIQPRKASSQVIILALVMLILAVLVAIGAYLSLRQDSKPKRNTNERKKRVSRRKSR